jgi:pimeloyl-ACP methyl ester carboxylesterase
VLIVHGVEDNVVPVAVARDLQQRIPGSRLTELPKRGHYFLYEEMESILTALLKAHQDCAPSKDLRHLSDPGTSVTR